MNKKYKKQDFKTPKGYFDGFTDKMMQRLSEEENKLPKEDGFKVPEGYFESLEKNIKARLGEDGTKVVRLNPYRRYLYAAASVAAIVLIAFGINWNTTETPTFDDLASSDLETYFENNDLELTSYEIAEVLSIEELKAEDILENQIDEENIIEYLDDTIDDFDELNTELDDLQQ